MTDDLEWLRGASLRDVAKQEFTWRFLFEGGGSITTEQVWRLVTPAGIAVASEDHGQRFGLDERLDAAARVLSQTKGKRVLAYIVTAGASDLVVDFGAGVRVEFLTLSCGYENWRAAHLDCDVICLGGGTLCHNKTQG